jgi:hypothetical protein
VDHYEPYLDFDALLRRTQASNTSFNEPGTVRDFNKRKNMHDLLPLRQQRRAHLLFSSFCFFVACQINFDDLSRL